MAKTQDELRSLALLARKQADKADSPEKRRLLLEIAKGLELEAEAASDT